MYIINKIQKIKASIHSFIHSYSPCVESVLPGSVYWYHTSTVTRYFELGFFWGSSKSGKIHRAFIIKYMSVNAEAKAIATTTNHPFTVSFHGHHSQDAERLAHN